MRAPNAAVLNWLDLQTADQLGTTSLTVLEILTGIERLPSGSKRKDLETRFNSALDELLPPDRIFPFDLAAAKHAAALTVRRQKSGRVVGLHDTQIAGIAISVGAAVATRNVSHFSDLAVPVINPWKA
jgi:toxin FitB